MCPKAKYSVHKLILFTFIINNDQERARNTPEARANEDGTRDEQHEYIVGVGKLELRRASNYLMV